MQKKQSGYPGIQMGTSFLLVIFIILCLVTFAVLSLSGAIRDQSDSQKTAEKTTAYYEACAKASAQVAAIDAVLQKAWQSSDDTDVCAEQAVRSLQELDGITVAETETGIQISCEIVITDSQNLEVSLETDKTDGTYTITEWKEVSSSEWDEKTTLPVLGSDQ